jgi:hypothetical protein
MNLQLFVKERLVASIPISTASMSNPFYLSDAKNQLQEKYKEIIDGSKSEPTFNVVPNTPFYSKRTRGYNLPLL